MPHKDQANSLKGAVDATADLRKRTEFMKLDAAGLQSLRQLKPLIDKALPEALDKFYEQARATPEAARFFSNEAHMNRAKGAQISHWGAISAGAFDEAYLARARTIGLTHARIGLEPRWYIGGYALIIDHIIKRTIEEHWPKGLLSRRSAGGEQLAESIAAMIKGALLDMDIALTVYIDASEEARVNVEQEARASEAKATSAISQALAKLANMDLTARITEDLPQAYEKLRGDFNSALQKLETSMGNVDSTSGEIRSSTSEIAQASDDLSRRTESQAASLEETAAAVQEITVTVQKTADGATNAQRIVALAKNQAEQSGKVVRSAISAMHAIEKSSKEINQIIGVIDEIAFQTNLLALNAGVEAARAGDAGRGFAVVASEVRALAQRSADAAKQIKDLISASSAQVGQGVKLVTETGTALEQIVGSVGQISVVVTDIAADANGQATGLQQVNTAVNQMDQVTQQNAAMVEEATAAARSLAQQADDLSRLVTQFKMSSSGASGLRNELKKVAPHAFQSRKTGHAPPERSWPKAAVAGGKAAEATKNDNWEDF